MNFVRESIPLKVHKVQNVKSGCITREKLVFVKAPTRLLKLVSNPQSNIQIGSTSPKTVAQYHYLRCPSNRSLRISECDEKWYMYQKMVHVTKNGTCDTKWYTAVGPGKASQKRRCKLGIVVRCRSYAIPL